MKSTLLRPVLAVSVAMALASCGGGGKATFPIHVEVDGLLFSGLVLSTNGMDVPVEPDPATPGKAVTFDFPKPIEYGQQYDVLPKGATDALPLTGSQPAHQSCAAQTAGFYKSGTAGQLQSINIIYSCALLAYPVGGTIKGLTGTGLVLINGTNGGQFAATPLIDQITKQPTDIKFGRVAEDGVSPALSSVPFGSTYGIAVLTQPTGQTCTVTGGGNGNGSGTINPDVEKNGGVSDIVVTCVANPT
jgi:hypothetical protein